MDCPTPVEAIRRGVELTTSRPVRISSQVSDDAQHFAANSTEERTRGADPREWTVSTAANGERKFQTVTAHAVED